MEVQINHKCTCIAQNISPLLFLFQMLTLNALHPLLVLATRHPSVVAMGTIYSSPSRTRGPATPTGTGI